MGYLESAQKLASEWHEAGRAAFNATYENLDYDSQTPKRVIEKRKYINLDEGSSGVYMVDKTNGMVYRIKSKYGVPNKKKCMGHITELTGKNLCIGRWY